MLQKVFRFRTCHLEISEDDDKRRFFRPCLLYPIKQCTAPCGARIEKEAYRRDIDRFIRFLESKRTTLTRELKKEMLEASEAQNYERAGELRDQIQALDKLEERGKKKDNWQPEAEDAPMSVSGAKAMEALGKVLGFSEPVRCMECIDIAHLQGGETVGSKVCFIDGRPFKDSYRRYKVNVVAEGAASRGDDYAAIREVVSRRYRDAGQGHELYPDVIQIDGGLGQLHAAMEAFDQLDVHPPMVISLAKKEELIYVQARSEPLHLSRHDPALRLCQAIRDEAHRFAQRYHHLLRRKSMLGDKIAPRRGKKRDGKPARTD
jgi:excinuclease ABC subunit C